MYVEGNTEEKKVVVVIRYRMVYTKRGTVEETMGGENGEGNSEKGKSIRKSTKRVVKGGRGVVKEG